MLQFSFHQITNPVIFRRLLVIVALTGWVWLPHAKSQSYCQKIIGPSDLILRGSAATADNGVILLSGNGVYLKLDNAGQVVWDHQITPLADEFFSEIIALSNGNFMLLETSGHRFEISPSGDVLDHWDFTDSQMSSWSLFSMTETSDGGLALVGSAIPRGNLSRGTNNLYLVKIKPDETVDWTSELGDWNHALGNKVIETANQKLIVVGQNASQIQSYGTKVFIASFLSDGTLETGRFIDHYPHAAIGRDIVKINNGFLLLGGTYLYKLDNQGIPIEAKKFNGIRPAEFLKYSNGDIYIVGQSSFLQGDLIVTRLNSQGVIQNSANYGSISNVHLGQHISRTSSNGLVVSSWLYDFSGTLSVPFQPSDLVVVKPDANGQACCLIPHTVALINDLEWDHYSDNTFRHGWGRSISGYRSESSFTVSAVSSCPSSRIAVEEEDEQQEIKLFPNPASDQLNIELPESLSTGVLSIFDLTGKLVLQTQIEHTRKSIDISRLAPGFYTVQLNSSTVLHHASIVVE